MAESFEIDAGVRSDKGKGASRRLRREGLIPGILYGAGVDPTMLTLKHNEILLHLEHEAFYSHILAIKVDGKVEKAVLKDVQRQPGKPRINHVDFLRVSETEKIRMHVPLHFVGEEGCPGVKLEGGSVSHLQSDIEISCLGKDLPEFIEVDMSAMKVGDSLHLSDLKLPSGVEIIELTHGAGHDLPVVSLQIKRGGGEDEEEAAAAAAAGADEESGEGGE